MEIRTGWSQGWGGNKDRVTAGQDGNGGNEDGVAKAMVPIRPLVPHTSTAPGPSITPPAPVAAVGRGTREQPATAARPAQAWSIFAFDLQVPPPPR